MLSKGILHAVDSNSQFVDDDIINWHGEHEATTHDRDTAYCGIATIHFQAESNRRVTILDQHPGWTVSTVTGRTTTLTNQSILAISHCFPRETFAESLTNPMGHLDQTGLTGRMVLSCLEPLHCNPKT
jgi:hypothetical protein